METQNLKPFLKKNMDVLFIGLNPSDISDGNGHYFSVNKSFWNQLFQSGLITKDIDKSTADEIVFGKNEFNKNRWSYGIADLVPYISDRVSKNIKVTKNDYKNLKNLISKYKPKTVCIIHNEVMKCIRKNGPEIKDIKYGQIGKIFEDLDTMFFYIPFPHGNAYTTVYKIKLYKELVAFLE